MGWLFRHMKNLLTLLCLLVSLVVAAEEPNVIIFMTDDIGYSDLGCFGSEIETPNVDALAKKGLRFSQFYNFGKCCPTRYGFDRVFGSPRGSVIGGKKSRPKKCGRHQVVSEMVLRGSDR
jgi:hypothetical protein